MEKAEELEEMMVGVCHDVVDDLSREINFIEEDIKVSGVLVNVNVVSMLEGL